MRVELHRDPDEIVCLCGAVVETYLDTDWEGSTFEYISIHYAETSAYSSAGSGVCTESDSYAYGRPCPQKDESNANQG